jgi:hypothetical protein
MTISAGLPIPLSQALEKRSTSQKSRAQQSGDVDRPRLRQLRPYPFVGGDGRLGFGVLTSGQIALPLFNSKDNFRFQAGYLDGASRYLLDVASTAPSAAYNATLTQSESIKAFGGFRGPRSTGGPIRSVAILSTASSKSRIRYSRGRPLQRKRNMGSKSIIRGTR